MRSIGASPIQGSVGDAQDEVLVDRSVNGSAEASGLTSGWVRGFEGYNCNQVCTLRGRGEECNPIAMSQVDTYNKMVHLRDFFGEKCSVHHHPDDVNPSFFRNSGACTYGNKVNTCSGMQAGVIRYCCCSLNTLECQVPL